MEVVPPRRGQRVKARILPPFNEGDAFEVVRQGERFGVVAARGTSTCSVWWERELVPVTVESADLERVVVPPVPPLAYTEFEATIGGVGKHLRWHMIFSAKTDAAVVLRVDGIADEAAFVDFVTTQLRPFGVCRFEFVGAAGARSTSVDVLDGRRLGMVAARLHCAGYAAKLEGVTTDALPKLAFERYDRSEHMWWNQDQEYAGPLRDTHRWHFDFVPAEWSLPFTWRSLARNVVLPLAAIDHLPNPLRFWFLTRLIEEAEEESVRAELIGRRGDMVVTCRLSVPQNRQLLVAAYWTIVAPFEETTVRASKLLRFRYMLHGFVSREIGGYAQQALHLGHGARIRTFRDKPQYQLANLSTEVLNQICRRDGSLRGSGFKGTRGKYGHPDFPRYEPKRRMRRTADQDAAIRRATADCFQHYREKKK